MTSQLSNLSSIHFSPFSLFFYIPFHHPSFLKNTTTDNTHILIMAGTNLRATLVALFAIFLASTYGPDVYRCLKTVGLLRKLENTAVASSADFVRIEDTAQCEDVHLHEPSGLLFTACEDTIVPRSKWFPPLANFDDPSIAATSQGSIHVIDPKVGSGR